MNAAIPTSGKRVAIPQTSLDSVLARVTSEASDLSQSFAAGLIDSRELIEQFGIALDDAHEDAARLGRLRAGDSGLLSVEDGMISQRVVDAEVDYLLALEQAILAGAFLDTFGLINTEKLSARLGRYAGRLVGTANEAFVWASPMNSLFYWRLGGVEKHCPDCPEMAANSPYQIGELTRYPGSNQTPCRWHCKCYLERQDNVTSFRL